MLPAADAPDLRTTGDPVCAPGFSASAGTEARMASASVLVAGEGSPISPTPRVGITGCPSERRRW